MGESSVQRCGALMVSEGTAGASELKVACGNQESTQETDFYSTYRGAERPER